MSLVHTLIITAYLLVLLYFNNKARLIHNIDKILTRLAEHNVRLSLSKCSFGNDNVKFLGYVVNEHGKQLPDS